MKPSTITQIANNALISQGYLSLILSGERRPSWPVSQRLEKATGISAVDWIDGRVDRDFLLKNYRPVSGLSNEKPAEGNVNKPAEKGLNGGRKCCAG